MSLPGQDCDDCVPSYLEGRSPSPLSVAFSSLPFFVTFLAVATLVFQRLFPLLSTTEAKATHSISTPSSATFASATARGSWSGNPNVLRRLSASVCSTTIALAAVLAELVLCEISETINPTARGVALRITIVVLLLLLVIAIPWLEIYSVVSGAGWRYTGPSAGRMRLAWIVQAICFGSWLMLFWASGRILPVRGPDDAGESLVNASTERIGIIGISLMALLSGFASVSTPWQTFLARAPPVSESTLARKQAGLDSTNDLLATKRSRLRALDRKLSMTAPPASLFQRAMGALRPSPESVEKQTLEMEVSGLENMALALSTHHSVLASRLAAQQRARSASGRLIQLTTTLFSIYCLYRVGAATISFVRRTFADPNHQISGSDPINDILALLARHYDAHLDRAAWTRYIAFTLSGATLLASLSSVLQTVSVLARFAPSVVRAARANLALGVAQLCATYVVSAALLLRGRGVGVSGPLDDDSHPASSHASSGSHPRMALRSLGGGEMSWVDSWFEVWFLGGALVTAVGIWVAGMVKGLGEWDDEDEDVELGKIL